MGGWSLATSAGHVGGTCPPRPSGPTIDDGAWKSTGSSRDVTMPEGTPRALAPDAFQRGLRWGAAVDRALRWLPGDAACLVRASALHELLVSRGLPGAVVRIGVRRDANGFAAHAWVELDGTPIAEFVSLPGAFSSLDGVTLR